MEMEHEHREADDTSRVYGSRTWSPSQIVAALAGFALVVLGGIALARLGFTGSITGEATTVAGMGATRLWAIIEIVLGLMLLGASASPFSVRGSLMTFGVLFAAFGVIVAVEPDAFADPLGVDQTSGLIWLITGIVLVIAAWASPTVVSEHRRSRVRHDTHEPVT